MEKVVPVVTGGGRGQGAVEAELLTAAGASVLICDALEAEGEALAAKLGEATRFLRLDVTDAEAWDGAVKTAMDWTGRLDVLVNNAGIINRKIIRDMTPEEWRRVIDVNLTGAFLGIRAAAPVMRQGGSIINISSNSAFSGHYDPAYTASKWALRGLTRTAAMEYAQTGIRVNAICRPDRHGSEPQLAPSGTDDRDHAHGAGGRGRRGRATGAVPGIRRIGLHHRRGLRDRRRLHRRRRLSPRRQRNGDPLSGKPLDWRR